MYGFRLVVDKADTCYRTLGVVHSVFKPMPGRFKDYIAIPRVNGYQSLHTTLFGPNGTPIEVQIRTSDMHRVAESGIAAHWQYKEGGGTGVGIQGDRAREWLQQLVEIQQGGNPEEFLESVKVDLFPDKVYVFTPKGEIRRLPRNSTCVDFAYAVHTDVGNRCVAAKVDRRLVPLRTPLRNGQTVEIIQQARPDPLQEPQGSAGGELPQDAAGDGARHPRHPGEARRPPAQHAHARRDAAGEAPQDRARDARHLRAGRRAPRHVLRSSSSSRTSASARSTRSATA